MKNILFFILNGNNGATYIINANSLEAISTSLEFYKAQTLRSKVLNQGLKIVLFLVSKLARFILKSLKTVNSILNETFNNKIDFQLDTGCSVLISPTRDKVIVHHHNRFYHKFACGKSVQKVKNESVIYNILPSKPKYFQVSKLQDLQISDDSLCSFKLVNSSIESAKLSNIEEVLVPTLTEFFSYSNGKSESVLNYLDNLFKQLDNAGLPNYRYCLFEEMTRNYGSIVFPLGLVHRDFKPWNLKKYAKPLIYDFEETVLNGPPLEDLFNYYIDPVIRVQSVEDTIAIILSKKNMHNAYLKSLNIDVDYIIFLIIYILERILFWNKAKEFDTSQNYVDLLNYINNQFEF